MSTVAERDHTTPVAAADPAGPVPPQIKFSPEGFSIDHPDPELGDRLMAGALGAADRDAMHGILRQLARASSKGRKPDAVNLAFMISMVRSIRPRDLVEAMLVAQMVSVHVMAMRCAHHLANAEDIARQDSAARALGKLPGFSGPDRCAQPLPQQWRACYHRAERVGSGRRQGHRRQRHAACERDRRGETKGRRTKKRREACARTRPVACGGKTGSAGVSDHVRHTGAMLASPRCGAKTRCGGSCRSPAVRGKRRCRMHGGAPKSGAPRRNHNARKHGRFTQGQSPNESGSRRCWLTARKLLRELKR